MCVCEREKDSVYQTGERHRDEGRGWRDRYVGRRGWRGREGPSSDVHQHDCLMNGININDSSAISKPE